jgi:hypothetical protein
MEQLKKVQEFRHIGTFNSLRYENNTKRGYFELSIFKKSKFALEHSPKLKSSEFTSQNNALKNNHLIKLKNEISSEPIANFNETDEFGPVETIYSKEFDLIVNKVNFKTEILIGKDKPLDIVGVMTVYDEKNNVIDWQGKPIIINNSLINNQFQPIEFEFLINPTWASKTNYRFEFYLWNKNKKKFYQKKMELIY